MPSPQDCLQGVLSCVSPPSPSPFRSYSCFGICRLVMLHATMHPIMVQWCLNSADAMKAKLGSPSMSENTIYGRTTISSTQCKSCFITLPPLAGPSPQVPRPHYQSCNSSAHIYKKQGKVLQPPQHWWAYTRCWCIGTRWAGTDPCNFCQGTLDIICFTGYK